MSEAIYLRFFINGRSSQEVMGYIHDNLTFHVTTSLFLFPEMGTALGMARNFEELCELARVIGTRLQVSQIYISNLLDKQITEIRNFRKGHGGRKHFIEPILAE